MRFMRIETDLKSSLFGMAASVFSSIILFVSKIYSARHLHVFVSNKDVGKHFLGFFGTPVSGVVSVAFLDDDEDDDLAPKTDDDDLAPKEEDVDGDT